MLPVMRGRLVLVDPLNLMPSTARLGACHGEDIHDNHAKPPKHGRFATSSQTLTVDLASLTSVICRV